MFQRLKLKVTIKILFALFGIGLMLFLVSWYIVAGGQTFSSETSIFRAFNDLPYAIRLPFAVISYLGTIYALLIICATLSFLKKYYWTLQIFLAGSIAWVVANAIKMAEIRERPYDLLSNVHLMESKDMVAGFPSAHAALITAVALALFTKEDRHIYWLLVLAVVLVGISRLVVGVHFPLDIVGGMGIGLMVGSVVKLIFLNYPYRKLNKKPHL
jgi:membrane-associated phospholipid phosphatase